MHFILITTTVLKDSTERLEKMIGSLKQYENSRGITLSHYLLVQNFNESRHKDLLSKMQFPSWSKLIYEKQIISLSEARNRMLELVNSDPDFQRRDTVVAFPDDDCWYPDGLLDFIAQNITEGEAEFIFCKYASSPVQADEMTPVASASYGDVVFNASSNTIFVASRVARKIGGFSEDLGVGAKYNGGEDLDYAIRSFRESAKTCWCDLPLVGHRDKDSSLRGNYFVGSALVLKRHSLISLSSCFHYYRKLWVGAFLVVTGKMPLSNFLKAVFGKYQHV